MPEGQFSGSRAPFLYTSDSGEVIVLLKDVTLATLPGTGLIAATTGNIGNATPKPSRFETRGVYWQGVLAGNVVRKFITCNANGTLYLGNVPQALTIDGVAGSTTGRMGERQSFLSVPPPAP